MLQESIKIPNIQNLNNAELKDKMTEILEKTSKENNIPVSAFEKVFGDSKKSAQFFKILSRENNVQEQKRGVKLPR